MEIQELYKLTRLYTVRVLFLLDVFYQTAFGIANVTVG